MKGMLSTNITEILNSTLDGMKNIQDVIIKSKLDKKSLKDISDSVKSITNVVKDLVELSKELSNIKIGVAQLLKIKLALKELNKVVSSILDFCKTVSTRKKDMDPKALEILLQVTGSLKSISTNILIFNVLSLGGLTFLIGTLGMLALKLFLKVFFWTFNESTLKSLKKSEKAIQNLAVTMLLLSMSVMVLALTGLLVTQSWQQFGMVTLFLLLVTGVFLLISLILKFMKEIKADKGIIFISLTILLLSFTVIILVLTGQLISESWDQIRQVGLLLSALVLAFFVIAYSEKWIQQGGKDLLMVAVAVGTLALTVFLIVGASFLIESASWENILLVFGVLLILIGALCLVALSSKLINDGAKEMLYIALAVGILSVAILIVIGSAMLLASVEMESIYKVFAVLTAMVVALAAVAFASKFIEKGSKSMMIITGCFIAMSVAVLLLSKASENLNWETFGIFAACVTLMTAICIGLGIPYVAAFAATGASVLLMISGAMLMAGASLFLMALAAEKIKKSGVTMDDVSIVTIPVVMMGAVVDAVYDNISMIKLMLATVKMGMLAFIAICIGRMAKTLSDIAALKMPTEFDEKGNPTHWQNMKQKDFEDAALSACALTLILTGLFADEPQDILLPGGKHVKFSPISMDSLENISFEAMIKFWELSKITKSIGEMAKVVQNIAAMNMPVEWNEKGDPVKFVKMGPSDFMLASLNIATIATVILMALTNPTLSQRLEDMKFSSMEKIKMVMEACSGVGDLIQAIKDVSSMCVPVEFDSKGKAKKYKVLTEAEMLNATFRITDLMTFYLRALTSEQLSTSLDKMSDNAAENISKVMGTSKSVGDLIQSIKDTYQMNEGDIINGVANIQTIITRYIEMMQTLFIGRSHIESELSSFGPFTWWDSWTVIDAEPLFTSELLDKCIDYMDRMKKTIDPFNEILEALKKAGDEKSRINTKKPLKAIQDYMKEIEKIEKIDDKKVKNNVDNLTRFIEKSSNVNIDQIKSLTEMFAEIAHFSETIDGNFEKLADVLNDKIVDSLATIADGIKTINESSSFGNSGEGWNPLGGNNVQKPNTIKPGQSDAEQAKATKGADKSPAAMNQIQRSLESIANELPEFLKRIQEIAENNVQ